MYGKTLNVPIVVQPLLCRVLDITNDDLVRREIANCCLSHFVVPFVSIIVLRASRQDSFIPKRGIMGLKRVDRSLRSGIDEIDTHYTAFMEE